MENENLSFLTTIYWNNCGDLLFVSVFFRATGKIVNEKKGNHDNLACPTTKFCKIFKKFEIGNAFWLRIRPNRKTSSESGNSKISFFKFSDIQKF